jgi:hypothetical protein
LVFENVKMLVLRLEFGNGTDNTPPRPLSIERI